MADVVAHVKKESTINQFTNYEFTNEANEFGGYVSLNSNEKVQYDSKFSSFN